MISRPGGFYTVDFSFEVLSNFESELLAKLCTLLALMSSKQLDLNYLQPLAIYIMPVSSCLVGLLAGDVPFRWSGCLWFSAFVMRENMAPVRDFKFDMSSPYGRCRCRVCSCRFTGSTKVRFFHEAYLLAMVLLF